MHCSKSGLRLIEEFEGGRSSDGLFHAYWDPWGKVWTIGFGQTSGVHQGMTWTLAQAEADLQRSLARSYEPSIDALGVALNQNQFDALCSFVWNLGPGSMQWDVGRYIRQHAFGAAANAMLQYDHAGGQRLPGLTRRRQAERALFLKPWANPDPHHYGDYDNAWRDLVVRGKHIRDRERHVAERYDELRRKQRRFRHPHRNELNRLKDEAAWFASRIAKVAQGSGGWELDHRRFRHDELVKRSDGRLVA